MHFPWRLSFKIGCDIAFFWLSTLETNLNVDFQNHLLWRRFYILAGGSWEAKWKRQSESCCTRWAFCLGKKKPSHKERSHFINTWTVHPASCQDITGSPFLIRIQMWDPSEDILSDSCLLLPQTLQSYLQAGH